MARERPRGAILGMTPHTSIARRLCLVWGVRPVICDDAPTVDSMTDIALDASIRVLKAQAGQTIVIAAGLPFGTPGSTNLLRIAQVS